MKEMNFVEALGKLPVPNGESADLAAMMNQLEQAVTDNALDAGFLFFVQTAEAMGLTVDLATGAVNGSIDDLVGYPSMDGRAIARLA